MFVERHLPRPFLRLPCQCYIDVIYITEGVNVSDLMIEAVILDNSQLPYLVGMFDHRCHASQRDKISLYLPPVSPASQPASPCVLLASADVSCWEQFKASVEGGREVGKSTVLRKTQTCSVVIRLTHRQLNTGPASLPGEGLAERCETEIAISREEWKTHICMFRTELKTKTYLHHNCVNEYVDKSWPPTFIHQNGNSWNILFWQSETLQLIKYILVTSECWKKLTWPLTWISRNVTDDSMNLF